MIVYALRCRAGHGFDAWFRSSADYDEQAGEGRVECPTCGSRSVGKAPMAPTIARRPADEGGSTRVRDEENGTGEDPTATGAGARARRGEGEDRGPGDARVEPRDVGTAFAREVRAMIEGERPMEAIQGLATTEEVGGLGELAEERIEAIGRARTVN